MREGKMLLNTCTQQFTMVEANYAKADTDYCYIPSNINISKMHATYVEWGTKTT